MSEKLTLEQALALLPEGGIIHTTTEAGWTLIGADWDREAILDLLERTEEIYPTTGMARAMGNALVAYEREEEGGLRRVFIEGRMD